MSLKASNLPTILSLERTQGETYVQVRAYNNQLVHHNTISIEVHPHCYCWLFRHELLIIEPQLLTDSILSTKLHLTLYGLVFSENIEH